MFQGYKNQLWSAQNPKYVTSEKVEVGMEVKIFLYIQLIFSYIIQMLEYIFKFLKSSSFITKKFDIVK